MTNLTPFPVALLLAESATTGVDLIPVVVYLSGRRRGITQRLSGDTLRIGSAPAAEIRLDAGPYPEVGSVHAVLHRSGASYELEVRPEHLVWVNGEKINDHRFLQSGDVLEVGRGGPLLRFRLYPAGASGYKSTREAFTDCTDCAASHAGGVIGHSAWFVYYMVKELATQTSLRFRAWMLALIVLLMLGIAMLAHYSTTLESRLESAASQLSDMSASIEQARREALSANDLAALKSQLQDDLSTTAQRVQTLEKRSLAGRQVVAAASPSVVFLQGGYRLVEEPSGRFLRHILGPGGQPLRHPSGIPLISLEGVGPEVEFNFTGTGFVATQDGLLLSNRHVARPWEFDETVGAIMRSLQLKPVMQRFVAYLPGRTQPLAVRLVLASDEADLAVLQSEKAFEQVAPLPLSRSAPQPGDEVIVMGYPTGLVAMLARLDEKIVDQIKQSELDFWSIAENLAGNGQINPLANRGIVGQISEAKVIYDALTASGGSGGPVLALNGEVVAVNTAVLNAFGGSNIGVPAVYARRLLDEAIASQRLFLLSGDGGDLEFY